MYDTVNIWLDRMEAGNNDLLASIPPLLDSSTLSEKDTGEFYITGKLGNYKTTIYDSGISLQGSLAKYHLPDNLHTLTRSDCQVAFEKMSDTLHLPIQKAKVTRLDIAQNFIMKYPAGAYYNQLGEAKYYKRLTQADSIYYRTSKRELQFYNKIPEAIAKGVSIPSIYQGTNTLRYELRFKNRLAQQLNCPIVTPRTLYNEQFYIAMVRRWEHEYQSINKLHTINFNLSNMNSPKDFFKQLALLKISEIGQNDTLKLIEELRHKEAFNKPEYYSRLKREVKELCKTPNLTEQSELITELDSKIKRVTNYIR